MDKVSFKVNGSTRRIQLHSSQPQRLGRRFDLLKLKTLAFVRPTQIAEKKSCKNKKTQK